MTPEQAQEENAKAQKEAWLQAEKLNCRKLALQYASCLKSDSHSDYIEQAQRVYDWLTKELE